MSREPLRDEHGSSVRARHQAFGLAVLGLLCCASVPVLAHWSGQQGPARWFWVVVGSVAGVICLIRAQRTFGGLGADRDASPYYGIFAGVASGAILLTVLTVESWVLPGVFLAVASVLALMAWIEQSAIGMTSALCVAVLSVGSGLAGLDDRFSMVAGPASVGVMLLAAAAAVRLVDNRAGLA